MSDTVLSRALRRETHSPRSVATVIVAIVMLLVFAYLAVEIILDLASQQPLLIAPSALLAAAADPASFPAGAVAAVGIVVAILGLVLIVVALSPGRLPKQSMELPERAVAVDNGVIASSLAQRVSEELGLDRRRVEVGVGHRVVDIAVRPVLGVHLDPEEVREIAEPELESYRLTSRLQTRVRVERPRESELEE